MKLFVNIIVLIVLTTTLIHASTTQSYSIMSTQELQIEVERLSNAGNLPFEMGLELIQRWKKA